MPAAAQRRCLSKIRGLCTVHHTINRKKNTAPRKIFMSQLVLSGGNLGFFAAKYGKAARQPAKKSLPEIARQRTSGSLKRRLMERACVFSPAF